MKPIASIAAMALSLASACVGSTGDVAVSDGGCQGVAPVCCVDHCWSDGRTHGFCADGGWKCPGGTVECCPDTSAPDASTLAPCADPDAGVCLNACAPGELCFTQVSCGPPGPDGGGPCVVASGAAADNRCHAPCINGYLCGLGERCETVSFFGCTDYNVPQRRICCDADAGC